ncbi:MAG: hypothetical protein C0601_05445 [Candidatus Muiribacterium halophilum]|uniref:NfeD-like C-terminal domain-containing protein n=1 Tax=Muiribacterium halophilum TaxID=2053465 RepID=A0A2N5ZHC8_MUIH1|nr:MAG: hypothetical protein C0601_05445 [Candidatus Muirbacterium halophilum]
MPELDIWIYWVVSGVMLMIAEIFTPGFVLALFGVAAIIAGIVAKFMPDAMTTQIGVFAASTFVLFVFVRKLLYGYFEKDAKQILTNADALVGKTGKVKSKVSVDSHGEVKVGGESWYAVPDMDEVIIEEGEKIVVLKVEGSKLIVKKGE